MVDDQDVGRFALKDVDRRIHRRGWLRVLLLLDASGGRASFAEIVSGCGMTDGNAMSTLRAMVAERVIKERLVGRRTIYETTIGGQTRFDAYRSALLRALAVVKSSEAARA